MERLRQMNRKTITGILAAAIALAILFIMRVQVTLIIRLVLISSVASFLLSPLCERFARRMKRSMAVAACFLIVFLALALILLLFVPSLIVQLRELVGALPQMTDLLNQWMGALNAWLTERGIKNLEINWDAIWDKLLSLAGGTATMAGSVVGAFTEIGLILPLAFYFLRDKEKILFHLELAIPYKARRMVLGVASSVRHELSLYVRGQLVVALIVGIVSAIGLLIAGARAWMVLGLFVGIFNLIPYFGPILGGIPTILMALSQGVGVTFRSLIVLVAVQQLDGYVISPNVTGSSTGFHPIWVLLGITVGGSLFGIGGMLFAVPAMLAIRAIMRIWVMRYEKV